MGCPLQLNARHSRVMQRETFSFSPYTSLRGHFAVSVTHYLILLFVVVIDEAAVRPIFRRLGVSKVKQKISSG